MLTDTRELIHGYVWGERTQELLWLGHNLRPSMKKCISVQLIYSLMSQLMLLKTKVTEVCFGFWPVWNSLWVGLYTYSFYSS